MTPEEEARMRERIAVAVKETLEKMMQPGSTPAPSREVGAVEITSKALKEDGWDGVERVAASGSRIRQYIR